MTRPDDSKEAGPYRTMDVIWFDLQARPRSGHAHAFEISPEGTVHLVSVCRRVAIDDCEDEAILEGRPRRACVFCAAAT